LRRARRSSLTAPSPRLPRRGAALECGRLVTAHGHPISVLFCVVSRIFRASLTPRIHLLNSKIFRTSFSIVQKKSACLFDTEVMHRKSCLRLVAQRRRGQKYFDEKHIAVCWRAFLTGNQRTSGCPWEPMHAIPHAKKQRIAMKKKCAQCHGRLGLGVRFRNLWSGHGWVHLRFCSARCESTYELEQKDTHSKRRWHTFLSSSGLRC
jgi:hypothetical protein